MSYPAIQVENLSKQYRIGARRPGQRTFREVLVDAARAPLDRFRRNGHAPAGKNTIWALRHVSFEVQPGEMVGIIGRNGAGKSTLLKILSRITEPTEGEATLCGRVGSLLEVGMGFHQELTGRENIYLCGAVLGMKKAEIDKKFDTIVAFAEVEPFVDTPVKHFSTGMYLRLAFAVAAHLDPEILVLDEVLAVGDIRFQEKCLGKVRDVTEGGKTTLFVSHNMALIRRYCSRAIVLDKGRIVYQGDVAEAVTCYENQAQFGTSGVWVNEDPDSRDFAYIHSVEILDAAGNGRLSFLNSEEVVVRMVVDVAQEHPQLKIGFDLFRDGMLVFRTFHVDTLHGPGPLPVGRRVLLGRIPTNLLNSGSYQIAPHSALHCINWLRPTQAPVLGFKVSIDPAASPFHAAMDERNHPGATFPLVPWALEGETP